MLVRPRVSAVAAPASGHRARGVHGGFVGHEVVTLDPVGGVEQSATSTRRRAVAGDEWRRRGAPAGTKVVITGVEGTTLIVWPADGHLPVEVLADGPPVDDGEQEQS